MRAEVPMWLSVIVLLGGCDKIKSWTGGDDKGGEPEPKPVVLAPEPLELKVKAGEVSVVAVKNGDTEVPAAFSGISGDFQIDDVAHTSGIEGELHIDLTSWDSKLEERDYNVRNVFFQVDTYPKAVFALESIDGLPPEGIAAGRSAEGEARGALSMHGATQDLTAKVRVSRAGDDIYHVDTVEPFFISVESFGLTPRLQELLKVCGHKSVDDSMRITLSLDLQPAPPDPDPEHKAITRKSQAERKRRLKALRDRRTDHNDRDPKRAPIRK